MQGITPDNVDVALVKFAETTLLRAFAAKIGAELGDFEWETKVGLVFDDVTSEGDGVVEPLGLVGGFDGGVAGLEEFVDLLLGVAASLGEEDFGTFDRGGLDVVVAMRVVGAGDAGFEFVKNGLLGW